MEFTRIPPAPSLNTKMRKFQYVYIGDSHDTEPHTAMAPTSDYLLNLLKLNLPEGVRVQIIKELPADDETRNYGKLDISKAVDEMKNPGKWAANGGLGVGTMMNADGIGDAQLKALQSMHGENHTPQAPVQQQAPQPVQQAVQPPAPQPAPAATQEPQYFKIGSIECKMENGKVYQKQWMRVSETELANYRLISDKNNKILPMTGKHLEVLKWAISEDEPAS